ncbi:MAG: chemotaxis protein CheC [Bordetella sp.]|uniref:chemotaxis protein CheC n=1 Tax=Bordetella sp. TaxID=28081 RepID=UPI003F7BAED0
MTESFFTEMQRDALQEISNLAMGTAAKGLSELLDAFIELSVPRVRSVAIGEAAHALREMTGLDGAVTAVRQSFRSGIKGEALVICRSGEIADLAMLAQSLDGESSHETMGENELVFDIANVVTGACVSSILDQLGTTPVFSPPGLIGGGMSLDEVFRPDVLTWDMALLLEVNFSLEDRNFRVHLVMLMAQESIRIVRDALDALLGET